MQQRVLTMMLVLFGSSALVGQIQVVGSASNSLEVVRTIASGIKFKDVLGQGPTVSVYNLDMTPFRTLILPIPLSGYSHLYMGYVTEALFDQDASTIEYALQSTMGSDSYVGVYREDGSTLMTQVPGRFGGNAGQVYFASDPVISTPSGTYMIVDSSYWVGSGSTVYLLPGQLPCSACDSSFTLNMNGGQEVLPPPGNLLAFPNPSAGTASIAYHLPVGAKGGEIIFFDLQGKEVKRFPVTGSGVLRMSTEEFPAGGYLYQLRTNEGAFGTKQLTVMP